MSSDVPQGTEFWRAAWYQLRGQGIGGERSQSAQISESSWSGEVRDFKLVPPAAPSFAFRLIVKGLYPLEPCKKMIRPPINKIYTYLGDFLKLTKTNTRNHPDYNYISPKSMDC